MKVKGEINNILWPNDLSKCSEAALPHVISLAKKYGASVDVLYVAKDLVYHDSWYGELDRTHIDRLTEWETRKAREHQQEFCQKYLENVVEYRIHIVIGDPYRKIMDFIYNELIDLVVMCRKGKSGDFNMGGTAQKVIEYSPVPVVITPGLDTK